MKARLTLASSVSGAVIVALDGTVLTVAQPTLRRDLHASYAQVQWTSTAYLVAVAGLLVFCGRLGDRYGHRRAFGLGMLGFGAASAAIAAAPGIGWVIGLRAVQGACGALLQPATLGMVRAAFPPERLSGPIAVRTSAIGLAAAAGPVAGGALVTAFGWRSVFLLGVLPAVGFGAAALWGAPGPERPDAPRAARPTRVDRITPLDHPIPLDLPGALLLGVALAGLVRTLVALPSADPLTLVCGAAALLAGAGFVRHERRAAHPLVPPALVARSAAGPALGVLVAASASLFGALFVGNHLLQDTLGLDPFHSSLRALPLAVLMVLAAPVCPMLLRRAGPRTTVTGAMAALATGVLLLAHPAGTAVCAAAFALLGAGFGTVMVAATQLVVRLAAVEQAGVAGGLQQTALNVGPALGVAAAAALMNAGAATDAAALPVLAGVALTGAMAGRALPGRAVASITPDPDAGTGSPVPARR
ncbi:MFS transporter [Streptomyces mangrovisoli]|uniref:MFS transporter n=1 Tax=Streptomyces mangrovisoli TaxID=1428628 RepID=A0A1J4NRN8_9ACTN|nr:MFS transporter [Streptomyces mangrovisoli]OIJ64770.1 MFS transporter [Streptomyces mangrovisoli]